MRIVGGDVFSHPHFSGVPFITKTIHGNPPTIVGFLIVIILLTRVLGSGIFKMNKTVPVSSGQCRSGQQLSTVVGWMIEIPSNSIWSTGGEKQRRCPVLHW